MNRTATLPFREMGLFEIYTLCAALSKMGNQILYFVIPLYIYQQTESALAMGIGWVFQTLPYVLTPWIGKWIDQTDKRRLFLSSELLQAVCVASIPLMALIVGEVPLGFVYAMSFVLQIGGLFSNVIGDYAFLPQLARTSDPSPWNSAYLTVTNLGRMAGPGVAGLLVLSGDWLSVLFLDSLSFLFPAAFVWLALQAAAPGAARPREVSIKEGYAMLRRIPLLFRAMVSFGLINLAMGGLNVFFLFLMTDRFAMTSAQIGTVMSLASVCGMGGAWAVTRWREGQSLIRRMRFWCGVLLVVMVPVPFLHPTWSLVGFVLSEGCMMALQVLFMSYRQQAIPDAYLGRVNATIRMILYSIVPVSSLVLTALAHSPWPALCGVFVLGVLAGGVGLLQENKEEQAK